LQKIINDNVVVGVLLLIEINVEGMRYIWKRRRIIKSRYVEVEERGKIRSNLRSWQNELLYDFQAPCLRFYKNILF